MYFNNAFGGGGGAAALTSPPNYSLSSLLAQQQQGQRPMGGPQLPQMGQHPMGGAMPGMSPPNNLPGAQSGDLATMLQKYGIGGGAQASGLGGGLGGAQNGGPSGLFGNNANGSGNKGPMLFDLGDKLKQLFGGGGNIGNPTDLTAGLPQSGGYGGLGSMLSNLGFGTGGLY